MKAGYVRERSVNSWSSQLQKKRPNFRILPAAFVSLPSLSGARHVVMSVDTTCERPKYEQVFFACSYPENGIRPSLLCLHILLFLQYLLRTPWVLAATFPLQFFPPLRGPLALSLSYARLPFLVLCMSFLLVC